MRSNFFGVFSSQQVVFHLLFQAPPMTVEILGEIREIIGVGIKCFLLPQKLAARFNDQANVRVSQSCGLARQFEVEQLPISSMKKLTKWRREIKHNQVLLNKNRWFDFFCVDFFSGCGLSAASLCELRSIKYLNAAECRAFQFKNFN